MDMLFHFFMCVLNTCVLGILRIPGPVQGCAEMTMSWTQPHVHTVPHPVLTDQRGPGVLRQGKHFGSINGAGPHLERAKYAQGRNPKGGAELVRWSRHGVSQVWLPEALRRVRAQCLQELQGLPVAVLWGQGKWSERKVGVRAR